MFPRVVLYAHDGSGFGHLMRISRLASRLQGRCACLVVTGTREAAWLVDRSCEFVKLPSWASMFRPSAAVDRGTLWLDLPKESVVRLRSEMIGAIVGAFQPDALIVDYLPFGLRNELLDTLRKSAARKYFVMRGVVDSSDYELRAILASAEFAALYDRVLVACDRRVSDALEALPFHEDAAAKCTWIGYMTSAGASRCRARPYGAGPVKIVCSAGSGLRGEGLFSEVILASAEFPSALFEIVLGTRSTLAPPEPIELPANVRVSTMRVDLPDLHASADVVVTSGGYNSLLEAATGGAEVIVCPVNRGAKDEQLRHARTIARFYPVSIAEEPAALRSLLGDVIARAASGHAPRLSLDVDGVGMAADLICDDLRARAREA